MKRILAMLLSLLLALTAMCASAEGDTFGAEDHEADRAFWLGSAPADRSLSAKEQA